QNFAGVFVQDSQGLKTGTPVSLVHRYYAGGELRMAGGTVRGNRIMVGAPGFEPGTSRTPSVRATRLRYAPTDAATNRRKYNNSTVSLAFEQRQETAQRIAQIQQHFAV